ncbi:Nucleoporin nup49/NSP49 (Nuclear pore protein nup49/NSP49) [Cryptotrichosporon argae]
MAFSFGAPAANAQSAVPSFSVSAPAQPASGSLFGAQPAPAQPASSGGMFGATAGGGGLFGAKPAAPAATGLFGSTPAPAASTSTSLFSAQPAQPAQATAGFGSAPAAAPTGGLFGSTAPGTQPASTGLFGASASAAKPGMFGAPAPAPSGGLFGQPAAQPPTGGLFGQSTSAPAPQSQPSGLFGQPAQARPAPALFGQQAPAAPASGIGRTTKFTDLPESAQKTIEALDAAFKDQKQIGAMISTDAIGRAIWQTTADVKVASDEYAAYAQGLAALSASLEQLAARFSTEAHDLQKLMEVWEAGKPAEARSGTVRPVAHRDFPHELFARTAAALEDRVVRYRKTIAELERAIRSLASEQEPLTSQALSQTIQNHQTSILILAAQLESLQLRMNDLRAAYAQAYRERTHTMRDPFEVAREEKGLPILRTR